MVSNSTLSGLFAAVALAAGATYVAWNVQDRRAEPPARLLVPGIDRFDTFEFHRAGLDLACDRTEEGWVMRRPIAGRADQATVRRFLDSVSTAAIRATQTERDMRRRGLSHDDLGIPANTNDRPRLVLGRGEASVEMTFGTNGVAGNLYVELDRHPGRVIHAVDERLADELPQSATPFRDQRLLPYTPERLRRLEVREGTSLTALEIGTNDVWFLRQPFEARADESRIQHILKYLFSKNVNTISDSPETEAHTRKCSPDEATLTARLWYSIPGNATSYRTITLLFGEKTDDDKIVYASIPEEHFLATVDAGILPLLQSVGTARDPRLFPGRRAEELVSMRLAREGGQSVTFRRGDNGVWSLVQPVPHPAQSDAVDAFAESLLGRVDEGLVPPDSAPDSGEAEAPKPFLTLAFAFQDGAVVTASVARAGRESPDAAPDADGTVWTLPQGPARLVAAPAPGERPWWNESALGNLLDPEILPDDGTGTPLVAERIESIAPLSVEPYGLLEPSVSIAIPGSDTTLLLGGTAPDGCRYAMLRGGYTVYAISPEAADTLLDHLAPPPTDLFAPSTNIPAPSSP